jgi:hypothetical protein
MGSRPSGPTARRALEQAGAERALDRIARARAKARARAWELIEATPAGFPWLEVAGKTLTGWMAIDMDATLITAHSDKDGAAPTWKKGYGFHPDLRTPERLRLMGLSFARWHFTSGAIWSGKTE